MKVYNVESQSKYHMKLTHIDNIEDAGDHFVTGDELKELGITRVHTYGNGIHTFDRKIKAKLNRLIKKLKAGTGKSIKIEDQDLVDMLSESGTFVSDYVKGIRRTGNRLSLHVPTASTKSKATKRDGKRFLDLAIHCIVRKHNDDNKRSFCIETRGGTENVTEKAINFIRHNMTWNEFTKWLKNTDEHGWDVNIYENDIVWYKSIYDNPKQFNA